MFAASTQHVNILKTVIEIKMSMSHTAVKFSSQSECIRDKTVSFSDTSIPYLCSTKDNWFLCIQTHSETLGKLLNLFVPNFFNLSNAYNEHLSHRTGVVSNKIMQCKRLCKLSSAVQMQCFNNNNLLKMDVALVSAAAFLL